MFVILIIIVTIIIVIIIKENKFKKLEAEVLKELGFLNWYVYPYIDEHVIVKSRQTLEKYDEIKFFKENKEKLIQAENIVARKNELAKKLRIFLWNNGYKGRFQYHRLEKQINKALENVESYRICVKYISSAGNNLGERVIALNQYEINRFREDPTLLMAKGEYNKYLRELQKETLSKKHHEYYKRVNKIIDYANKNRDKLVVKGGQEQLDNIMGQLFDRTVNSIKKIKAIDSEEWDIIGDFIEHFEYEIDKVICLNEKILAYYYSQDFLKIKETCEVLMSTQREFNEYIIEKVESISQLFGTRVVRNETINDDQYNYIRPYKKTITPFSVDVSAAVFASAENNPLEYIIKYFYPNKSIYQDQIQKLYLLIEEIETLKDAKQIIENYKVEYQQYLVDVPAFIMENNEEEFYSRLGFANINESVLAVEYRFSYTSGGGMAKRSFSVPMTEETIAELIRMLENKLTSNAFVKEQRMLMTKKLREYIKKRDNFTCCICGNSTYTEPNLLLEIDHINPVSKGGRTEENNLQTLCWKCNRSKGSKIII